MPHHRIEALATRFGGVSIAPGLVDSMVSKSFTQQGSLMVAP